MSITIGVTSDTHIPDRVRKLNPRVLPIFREAQVSAILHAGDISTQAVINQLASIAPVYAVRGNRDWLLRRLPVTLELEFCGVPVILTHGHGRWSNYLIDRTHSILHGFNWERFQPRLLRSFPDAKVIVFGHTHYPLNRWVEGKLLF